MRPISPKRSNYTLLVVALLSCCGCKSAEDRRAPAGMTRTTLSERVAGQRLEDSKVPLGDVVEGQHAK